ncbi:MAG: acyl-CoA dehydrogenase family protein [Candidatus Binatia bacterium]
MDFAFTEEQEAICELAANIFGDLASPELLKAAEDRGDCFHTGLWRKLADTGLLGVAVPKDFGGQELGIVELCLILWQQGRSVAPVPVLESLVMGALTLARFGSDDQKERWLPGVASGEVILGAAVSDAVAVDASLPATRARPEGSGWILDGVKILVSVADRANRIVVPATTPEGRVALFLIDPAAEGIQRDAQEATTGERRHRLTITNLRADGLDMIGEPDGLAWDFLLAHGTAGLCVTELGVVEKALEITAGYTTQRKQFDKAIATFQAVAQRAADAYIDVDAIRLTAWQAVWRLSEGLPATEEVAIAKFWAAEGGHRAAYACQHLHGGIGVDREYPLHRYYLWSKQIELTLGCASSQLAWLGKRIALEEGGSRPPSPSSG